MEINQKLLHELFDYDVDTGILTRRVARGRFPAGAKVGSLDRDGYVRVGVGGSQYYAHRLVVCYVTGTMPPPSVEVDHEDSDRKNNRFENLRACERLFNSQNTRASRRTKGRTSNYLGVHKEPRTGRFRARIRVNGRMLRLGTFTTELEASHAYITAKRIHHPGNTL